MSERISALMDGESLPGSGREGLEAISTDPEAGDVWERYHTLRYVIRNESSCVPDGILRGSVAARVRQFIDAEPTCLAPAPLARKDGRARRRWRGVGVVGGLAVAASVIVAVTIGLRSHPETIADFPATTVAATQWQTEQPEYESDLNTFLVQHGEFSTPSGLNGLTAYAKIVSYDARR